MKKYKMTPKKKKKPLYLVGAWPNVVKPAGRRSPGRGQPEGPRGLRGGLSPHMGMQGAERGDEGAAGGGASGAGPGSAAGGEGARGGSRGRSLRGGASAALRPCTCARGTPPREPAPRRAAGCRTGTPRYQASSLEAINVT